MSMSHWTGWNYPTYYNPVKTKSYPSYDRYILWIRYPVSATGRSFNMVCMYSGTGINDRTFFNHVLVKKCSVIYPCTRVPIV